MRHVPNDLTFGSRLRLSTRLLKANRTRVDLGMHPPWCASALAWPGPTGSPARSRCPQRGGRAHLAGLAPANAAERLAEHRIGRQEDEPAPPMMVGYGRHWLRSALAPWVFASALR